MSYATDIRIERYAAFNQFPWGVLFNSFWASSRHVLAASIPEDKRSIRMAPSAELVTRKILAASAFLGGLGGSLMPLLFNYALVAEQGIPLHIVSVILLAGPCGLLLGNRAVLPRLSGLNAKVLMLMGHGSFAIALLPILLFSNSPVVIFLCLFTAFVGNSLYLPARSEYILFVGNSSGLSASVSFRGHLRFLTYFSTGIASVVAVAILYFQYGSILQLAVFVNVATRSVCALLISQLPRLHGSKGRQDEAGNAAETTDCNLPRPVVPKAYVATVAALILASALCGSYVVALPLVVAQLNVEGGEIYPLLLGAMTILAAFLHRNETLKHYASQHQSVTLTTSVWGSALAFLILFGSLAIEHAGSLVLTAASISMLTVCNVAIVTLHWEYSYQMPSARIW
ncbi:hypothetical protein G7Y31_00990 [Corynebacterium lizhenjunii]|uniref:Uncharacterized protein n=1 Tax=Corynebacterium lizhenjunii TaxID=2709394 RepID=A0A7T0PA05_9CORY|nr:hypothetical protein [Corynebacterium lizhenjunii]QPK79333.1 hypothetical protein G7Y31_00990 [Corynebacterium lizhenjunii]